MLDRYVIKDGKRLRYGYTTGSCAAAAAKAAAIMLFSGKCVDAVDIDTPKGWRLHLDIEDALLGDGFASCAVRKDGGDDPDVTDGLLIYAYAQHIPQSIIDVEGGDGVGLVTKPGLQVPPGLAAINPVPMSMIRKEVSEVLPPNRGVKITIRVPNGKKVAERTFNPQLGIEGGISILGTTGIVEPMSNEALKESLALRLHMLAAQGQDRVCLVPGNYGRDFAIQRLGMDERWICPISDFVGYMLEQCVEYGMRHVLMVGHAGKLVKIAGGIFQTHNRVADARMEIIAAHAAALGGDAAAVRDILNAVTTEAAFSIIERAHIDGVYDRLIQRIGYHCRRYMGSGVEFGCAMFSMDKGLLAMDEQAKHMVEGFKHV
ncbi:MAG: cobalt-precorrin-5B (C1)-methyltransferase [Clostridiales bacterium]|nr:cobalt-precorrin-5B (C1)-methyltransferase [Clostridiales bacterium]